MSAGPRFPAPAVPVRDLDEAQLAAWSSCADDAVVANPFFEPACQVPAVEHYAQARDTHLVVAEAGGTVLACMPVIPAHGRFGPLRRPVAHTRPFDGAIALGAPLVRSGARDEAAARLVDAMAAWARSGGPGTFVLDWLDMDEGGVGAGLLAACARRGVPVHVAHAWERPVARRSGNGLLLEPGLNKKHRGNLRNARRRLATILGGEPAILDLVLDPGAVEDFIALETAGWKGTEGGALGRQREKAAWFRDLTRNFAGLGRLHLLSLGVPGRTAAMAVLLRAGAASAFGIRVAHDEALRTCSPGVLLHLEVSRYLEALGVDLIDTCSDPGNPFLARLFPDRRHLATVLVAPGGTIDRAAVRALPLLAATRRLRAGAASERPAPA